MAGPGMEDILSATLLLAISEKINPTVTPVHAFSVYLGVPNATGDKELIKGLNMQDLSLPYYNLLQHYIGKHGTGRESAMRLRDILRKNNMVPVAEVLETALGGREVTGGQGPSCKSSTNETEEISPKVLHQIATDIGGANAKLMKLGLELEFSRPQIEQYLESNRMGSQVTARGTSSMLFDWQERTLKKDQCRKLREALVQAGLSAIAERHLPK